jgi:hypothetical protein
MIRAAAALFSAKTIKLSFILCPLPFKSLKLEVINPFSSGLAVANKKVMISNITMNLYLKLTAVGFK